MKKVFCIRFANVQSSIDALIRMKKFCSEQHIHMVLFYNFREDSTYYISNKHKNLILLFFKDVLRKHNQVIPNYGVTKAEIVDFYYCG